MRAKSRNMVHRHIPADKKAAIFLTAVEMYPELKEAIEEIKADNSVRRKEGKPLVAGDQAIHGDKVLKSVGFLRFPLPAKGRVLATNGPIPRKSSLLAHREWPAETHL